MISELLPERKSTRYREISRTKERVTRIECPVSSHREHSPNFSAHTHNEPSPGIRRRRNPIGSPFPFPRSRQDFSLFRWPVGPWKTHVSTTRRTHDRSGCSTHSSSLVKHERMARTRRLRNAIKRARERGRGRGSSSLTTIVEKQGQMGGPARGGEEKVKVQRGRKRPVRVRVFYYAGLSRLWHSCFEEPGDSG